MPCGDGRQYRIAQHLAIGKRHVRGDGDALLFQVGGQRAALQVGRQFDLVGGDFAFADHGDGLLGQRDVEIRDADPARQSLRLGVGQRRHEFGQCDTVVRRRPVDQGQVDLVDAQLGQAVAQTWQQGVAAIIGGPDLGGDEDVVARHSALDDGLADFGLVAVDLGGVDGAIAQFEGAADRVDDGLAGQAERADAEGRDGHGGFRCGQ